MKIEELIKNLDPVTIIEFKNYLIEHLSDICGTKDSNSKIISKFKNEEMYCKKCGCKIQKMVFKNIFVVDVKQHLQKQQIQ